MSRSASGGRRRTRLTTVGVASIAALACATAPGTPVPAAASSPVLATARPASPAPSAVPAVPAASAMAATPAGTFTNPVSTPGAPSFPDPSVIHGKDGFWYAFGTSDPILAGGRFPQIPILRSVDLVHWRLIGQVFPGARPAWVTATAGLWAPDIRFVDGHYVLYYVATDTVALPGDTDSAIGVATAPTPAGPWTDSGGPLIAPRPGNGSYLGTIDPAGFTDRQGRHWLYWSSFDGGGFVTRLSADGLHAVGSPSQILIDNRYEGIYVVSHGNWYYAFASSSNCCAGPVTGYAVFAGRSRSPEGPFVDADGVSLDAPRVGGTQVIAPNGNRWVGTGHNAVVTDDSGQDWFVYHAIPSGNPYLAPGVSRRPMLVDRLDWIDGWPTVRAGLGASDTPQADPVTSGMVDDTFGSPSFARRWQTVSGKWTRRSGVTAGGYVHEQAGGPGILLSRTPVAARTSSLADVRVTSPGGTAVYTVRYAGPGNEVAVEIDRARRALVIDTVSGGHDRRAAAPLPAGFDYSTWQVLDAQVSGDRVTASVSADDLHDPVAQVTALLPTGGPTAAPGARRFALVTSGRADIDNVHVSPLAIPVTVAAPLPRTTGAPLSDYSTDFDGTQIPAGWTWVRRDPAAHVAGGALVWPVQTGDLNNDPANAGILLHTAPTTDWVAQTRLTLPLGVDDVRNFQQAGLAAYVDDDDIARVDSVAIFDTRQIEFNRKLLYDGKPLSAGTVLGHGAEHLWLRIYAHRNAAGRWEVRAASSNDGRTFDFGGTWVFPEGATPRIGLVSLGNVDPTVPVPTAQFDSVTVWRLASPSTAGFPD
jgi:arabinan endo-1,5-alpha-L-arabinosidase